MVLKDKQIAFLKELNNYKVNEVRNFENNKSLGQIHSEVKSLFEKNDVTDSDYQLLQVIINSSSVDCSVSSLSKSFAKNIYDKKQKPKDDKQRTEDNKNKQQKPDEQTQKKKKPSFNFNLVSVGEMNIAEIETFFRENLIKQGYTTQELNSSKDFNILDFNDKAMDLGINTNATMVEQLAEATQKLYAVLVNGMSIEDAKKLNPHDLKKEATEVNLDLPGTKNDVQKTLDSTNDDPKEINVSTDGEKADIENTPDNDLTEQDLQEIKMYGIEGIGTHKEMEEFRNSEEYQMLTELSRAMEKNDYSDIV